jgi:uncharacterized membrane protein YedE/YeeE
MSVTAVTIVICGAICGMTILHARWNQFAPSIMAASTVLISTFCKDAWRIRKQNPVCPQMAAISTA